MSSVVFNANAVGKTNELFPTTIGSATKMYQRYQHIMPAPEQKALSGNGNGNHNLAIKTRKYTPRCSTISSSNSSSANAPIAASTLPYSVDQSQSVQRRNARERNRVKQVNNSFARLRQHIPQSIIADLTKGGGRGPHKKISKVDTLRIAVEYIRRLQDLVDDLNGVPAGATSNNFTQLNLCLDETSSQSSSSSSNCNSHSSGSSSAGTSVSASASGSNSSLAAHSLYYSSSLLATPTPNANTTITALQQQQQLQRQQYPNHPLAPISLNATTVPICATNLPSSVSACHSPTSSFNSSMSFDSGTYEAAPQQLSPPVSNNVDVAANASAAAAAAAVSAALDAQLQLKFEPYEHFQLDEEDCTPDDEEILDYISLWQEQ